jgi:chromosome segregation ATPase
MDISLDENRLIADKKEIDEGFGNILKMMNEQNQKINERIAAVEKTTKSSETLINDGVKLILDILGSHKSAIEILSSSLNKFKTQLQDSSNADNEFKSKLGLVQQTISELKEEVKTISQSNSNEKLLNEMSELKGRIEEIIETDKNANSELNGKIESIQQAIDELKTAEKEVEAETAVEHEAETSEDEAKQESSSEAVDESETETTENEEEASSEATDESDAQEEAAAERKAGAKLDEETIEKIKQLKQEGKSYREIHSELGVSLGVITKVLKAD